MRASWHHVRPIDRYQVRLTEPISLFQIKTLYQLYQPLVGHLAVALYATLWSETEGDFRSTAEKKHDWLMKELGVTLDKIYEARLRLEAVGLLRTFQFNAEEYRRFTYELYPPLAVEQFFNDDIFKVWLYNQVGTAHFTRLRARFSRYVNSQTKDELGQEVTKPFYDVFTSIHPSELMLQPDSQTKRELEEIEAKHPMAVEKVDDHPVSFDDYPLDLELVSSFMMKGIDRKEIFTPANVKAIKKIAFFYGFNEEQMGRLIQDALGTDNQLNMDELRRLAQLVYRAQHDRLPQIDVRDQKPVASSDAGPSGEQGLSLEEQHLQLLETLSPLQLLAAYQGGGKVAEADERLVEELIFDYQLPPGVVNVLLEYILLTNQLRLPRNLTTKVAAHWKRLKITEVKQALELAKKEHQQYKTWQEKRQQEKDTSAKGTATKGSNRRRNEIREAVLPEWIREQASKQDSPSREESGQATAFSEAEKRKRIKSLLKALGEWEE